MFDLPLFPLHTVLFPDMPIQLHIFEERYRQMMHRCLQNNLSFGVVLIRAGLEAYQQEIEIYTTGCTAHIAQVEHLKDGKMNLMAQGEQRFRILKTNHLQPYLSAQAEIIPLEWQVSLASNHNLGVFRRQMSHYLKILSQVHTDDADLSQIDLPDDALLLLNLGASILQIPPYEKQTLLEAESGVHLLEKLQHIFRRETAVLKAIQRRESTPSNQDIRNN
jgi:Lon protease-like protein